MISQRRPECVRQVQQRDPLESVQSSLSCSEGIFFDVLASSQTKKYPKIHLLKAEDTLSCNENQYVANRLPSR